MALIYRKGDATLPPERPAIIAHVCNNRGGWGRGFVLAVSTRWPEPEREFRNYSLATGPFSLGIVQFVSVEPNLWVANMVAQDGIGSGDRCLIDWPWLDSCLQQLMIRAKRHSASIHMPRIGCGLAGAKWEDMEPVILRKQQLLAPETPICIYDL